MSKSQALLKLHYYSQLPQGEQYMCTTPNPEMIVAAAEDPHFHDILRKADFSLADGSGILWASGFVPLQKLEAPTFLKQKRRWTDFLAGIKSLWQFARHPENFPREIRSRVTGSDLFGHFLATSQAKIFLLGGSKGAAALLHENFANIAGYYDGVVNEAHNPQIRDLVNASAAEVLFVALGAPKQEFWIAKNLKQMPNIRFAMGVGGAFDFLAGYQKRAPVWMQEHGLEWLYRLFREPFRVGRIWRATVQFFLLTLRERSGEENFKSGDRP